MSPPPTKKKPGADYDKIPDLPRNEAAGWPSPLHLQAVEMMLSAQRKIKNCRGRRQCILGLHGVDCTTSAQVEYVPGDGAKYQGLASPLIPKKTKLGASTHPNPSLFCSQSIFNLVHFPGDHQPWAFLGISYCTFAQPPLGTIRQLKSHITQEAELNCRKHEGQNWDERPVPAEGQCGGPPGTGPLSAEGSS